MQDRDSSSLRNPKAKNVQGNSSKVWMVTYTAIVYIYIIVSNIYLHALLHIQVISGPEFIRTRARDHVNLLLSTKHWPLYAVGRACDVVAHTEARFFHEWPMYFKMNAGAVLKLVVTVNFRLINISISSFSCQVM